MRPKRHASDLQKIFSSVRVLWTLLIIAGLTFTGTPQTALAQGPCGATETVVYRDTLRKIANRCDTSVTAILNVNPEITNPNLIFVGQVINIPRDDDEMPDRPGEAAITIQPSSGPAGSTLYVTGQNYPALTEVIVGIGAPASEPVTSFRAMTNASGTLNTQIAVPTEARVNERFVVVAYVPGRGGARAISQEFVTTSGEQGATVLITPQQGPPASDVRLRATGFAANRSMEIGFGRVESEYDIVARVVTDANGSIDRQVQVPGFANAGAQYVFVVRPEGTSNETISNVFTATGNGETQIPQITISPRQGAPDSNIQVAISGFPMNTRISYGIGELNGQLLDLYSTRTNRNGTAQVTLQVPNVDPNVALAVTAFVPRQGGASATSGRFTVTGEQDDSGQTYFTRTNIYLVALEDAGQSGLEIGCGDSVIPVEVQFEPTVAPLTAALGELFALNERFYGQSGLYNALYRSDLAVERIDIVNGVASLYLTGQLQVGGVCDEPRVRAQLEETALQYYTVSEVRIYINGEPLSF